jgi:GxxExxY protein
MLDEDELNYYLELIKDGKLTKENDIARLIYHCGLLVHYHLGPGLLETAYEHCLMYELKKLGLNVQNQVLLPLIYKGIEIDAGYRIDLLVENKIIIELKSVSEINPIFVAQTLTYLKLSNLKLGLLINFNTQLFKDGVKRIVNKL